MWMDIFTAIRKGHYQSIFTCLDHFILTLRYSGKIHKEKKNRIEAVAIRISTLSGNRERRFLDAYILLCQSDCLKTVILYIFRKYKINNTDRYCNMCTVFINIDSYDIWYQSLILRILLIERCFDIILTTLPVRSIASILQMISETNCTQIIHPKTNCKCKKYWYFGNTTITWLVS